MFFKSTKKNNDNDLAIEDEAIDLDVNSSNSIDENEKEDWMEPEGQLTIDVYQTPSDIVVKSAVAGVQPEDIDIAITGDMVTIKGKREVENTVNQKDYFYQECYWGRFSRSIILPTDVDSDRAVASLKNGILTVKLPKIDKEKVKKIKIKEN